jgi:hypothetical protein
MASGIKPYLSQALAFCEALAGATPAFGGSTENSGAGGSFRTVL